MTHLTLGHDFFFQFGGAERVTSTLANETFAGSAVIALGGDQRIMRELQLERTKIIGSAGLNANNYRTRSLAAPVKLHRELIEGNLISSSYAFIHHLRATGLHLVYCHSPLRQIWSGRGDYARGRLANRLALRGVSGPLRKIDRAAARRADAYVATNKVVASRVTEFYGVIPYAIVPPPIDDRFFSEPIERGETYVWAGRIVEPYKRLGLVIEAFRNTKRQLVVVGDGRDRARLESAAPPNVTFVGRKKTSELASIFAGSKALIFPSEDDFGMVPIEAMASGTPVIAWDGGGPAETVREGVGIRFREPTTTALHAALTAFESQDWDPREIHAYAKKFSTSEFSGRMRDVWASLDR
ncbi:glycosyltransferase [Microbacterium sp. HMH0099]|uniref:glycosyltransferase n=1 Tax=Microbacterium sp. HMH0099 TaxID=3414026 RepID=UPI003BF76696